MDENNNINTDKENSIGFKEIKTAYENGKKTSITQISHLIKSANDKRGIYRKIEHFCQEDYKVIVDKITRLEKYYVVINEKEKKYVAVWPEEIAPKSVREKLKNIEKNRKFYESKK